MDVDKTINQIYNRLNKCPEQKLRFVVLNARIILNKREVKPKLSSKQEEYLFLEILQLIGFQG